MIAHCCRKRKKLCALQVLAKIKPGTSKAEKLAMHPESEGIEICWVHRNAAGSVDLPASRAAAQAMAPTRPTGPTTDTGQATVATVSWAGYAGRPGGGRRHHQ